MTTTFQSNPQLKSLLGIFGINEMDFSRAVKHSNWEKYKGDCTDNTTESKTKQKNAVEEFLEDKNAGLAYFHNKITVAYKREGKFLKVANAVCHPTDKFSRKVGREMAVSRFNEGKYICIPVNTYDKVFRNDRECVEMIFECP